MNLLHTEMVLYHGLHFPSVKLHFPIPLTLPMDHHQTRARLELYFPSWAYPTPHPQLGPWAFSSSRLPSTVAKATRRDESQ